MYIATLRSLTENTLVEQTMYNVLDNVGPPRTIPTIMRSLQWRETTEPYNDSLERL